MKLKVFFKRMLDCFRVLVMTFVFVSGVMAVMLPEEKMEALFYNTTDENMYLWNGGGTLSAGAVKTEAADSKFSGSYDWDGDISTLTLENFEYSENSQNALYNNALSVYNFKVGATPGGTIWGTTSGNYQEGTQINVSAEPNEGFHFVNWTLGLGGSQVSKNKEYSFTITEDIELLANFAVNIYTVAVYSIPSVGGTVTGGGRFQHGENITIVATANDNYEFVAWKNMAGDVISLDANYSFTVESAKLLVAYFEMITCTVTVTANNLDYGTVSGGEIGILRGEEITVKATVNEGYEFVNWENGNGVIVSKEAEYTFIVMENVDLKAYFKPEDRFFIAVVINPPGSGTVQGGKMYYIHDQPVVLTAEENTGYHFVNWTNAETEAIMSESSNYSFTAIENITLVANFNPECFTVQVSANPEIGGSVTGEGTYIYGERVTVTATADTGYKFVNWTNSVTGELVYSLPVYSFYASEDIALIANFEVKTYTVTITANNLVYGNVTGGATDIPHGTQITVSAMPNTGFEFVNWINSENGMLISLLSDYSFTIEENVNLTANFKPEGTFFVTIEVNPTNSGTVTGGGYYDEDDVVTVTASGYTGFAFENWTDFETGEILSKLPVYSFNATKDVVLTANFELEKYEITVLANPQDYGTATGSGIYSYGERVHIKATPAESYTFVNWTKGGEQISTNAEYSFNAIEKITVTATFALKTYQVTFKVVGNDNAALTATIENDIPIASRSMVEHGSNVVFIATPPDGHCVKKWTLNGEDVIDNKSVMYRHENLSEAISVTIEFEEKIGDNSEISNIEVDGVTAERNDFNFSILARCHVNSVNIIVNTEDSDAIVEINGITGKKVDVSLPKYGDNIIPIKVIALNGDKQHYTLKVYKMIPFWNLVVMRWNNTMSIINNPENNGGYTFEQFRWFRDGELFCTDQWWSAGANGEKVRVEHEYYVEVTTTEGETLRTCPNYVALRSMEVTANPNPVTFGNTIYIEADVEEELLKDAVIQIYNMTGYYIESIKVEGRFTPVDIRYASGLYVFVFKGADGFKKELKVVVK